MLKPPFRLLLADDHVVLRAGLRMLLSVEPDMEVVGEADTGRQAIEQAAALQPDIILLDVTMPDLDGLAALPQLKKVAPQVRVLILTMHQDEAYLRQALQSGAAGYVLKKAADIELLSAIRAVARGELYVHPAMTKLLLGELLPPSPLPDDDEQRWQSLSEREQQVVRGVVLGYTSEEIAEKYYLSAKTVYTYRSRAMLKLGLDNRAQLVDLALRLGILSEENDQ
jgi:two-component system, NarL family, response regulator NreC